MVCFLSWVKCWNYGILINKIQWCGQCRGFYGLWYFKVIKHFIWITLHLVSTQHLCTLRVMPQAQSLCYREIKIMSNKICQPIFLNYSNRNMNNFIAVYRKQTALQGSFLKRCKEMNKVNEMEQFLHWCWFSCMALISHEARK